LRRCRFPVLLLLLLLLRCRVNGTAARFVVGRGGCFLRTVLKVFTCAFVLPCMTLVFLLAVVAVVLVIVMFVFANLWYDRWPDPQEPRCSSLPVRYGR
jgi:hypothetical protein